MSGSLSFLTPLAGLLAVFALVPLAALAVALRRVRGVRLLLGLEDDGNARTWLRALALAGVSLLLALALMQPVLRRHGSESARADAAAFVVIDTSSSMGAASSASAPTRLAQAKRIAIGVTARLGGIPVGIATFTDRVLPNSFPTIDQAVVDSTIESLGTDSPPPRETARVATAFSALGALARASFFTKAQTHRALLLLTDGESRAFGSAALARALSATPQIHVVVVQVGRAGDRLHSADGRAGSVYRADPGGARQAISQLVAATGGRAVPGSAAAATALRNDLGSGPTTRIVSEPEVRALAPFVVLLSLIPLLALLASSGGSFLASRRGVRGADGVRR